jgi:hypothetical protein
LPSRDRDADRPLVFDTIKLTLDHGVYELLDAVWGTDFVAGSTVVDRHVRALRAKLRDDWRKPRFIATEPGVGYRFVPDLAERHAAS